MYNSAVKAHHEVTSEITVSDADDLDALVAAAEDLADIKAAADARHEMAGGEPAIPWDQVKADLGLA